MATSELHDTGHQCRDLKELQQRLQCEPKYAQDSEELLQYNISVAGLRIACDTPGDGSCMLHALLSQSRIHGHPLNKSAEELRNYLILRMQNQPVIKIAVGSAEVEQDLRDFCTDPDWQSYLNRMSNYGEYGDHILLQAAAHYLHHPILVIGSSPQGGEDQNTTMITCHPKDMNNALFQLGHRYENHYESLIAKEESLGPNPPKRLRMTVDDGGVAAAVQLVEQQSSTVDMPPFIEEDGELPPEDTLHPLDKFSISRQTRIDENVTDDSERGRLYYPQQICLASRIFDRFTIYIDKYTTFNNWDYFNDFDFQIYTARTNMLENQTSIRLASDPGCFPPQVRNQERYVVEQHAKERVSKYILDTKVWNRHKALRENAQKNPKKLFLIIADEAHWGITRSLLENVGEPFIMAVMNDAGMTVKGGASEKKCKLKALDTKHMQYWLKLEQYKGESQYYIIGSQKVEEGCNFTLHTQRVRNRDKMKISVHINGHTMWMSKTEEGQVIFQKEIEGELVTDFEYSCDEKNEQLFGLSIPDEGYLELDCNNRITYTEKGNRHMLAQDELINTWNFDDFPNVMILLVTATPYNLLTDNSRIPKDIFCEWNPEQQKLVSCATTWDPKQEKLVSYQTDTALNHIRWTESFHHRLECGIVTTLIVPIGFGPDQLKRLNVGQVEDEHGLLPWICDSEGSQFIIRKHNEGVSIFTFRKDRQLCVTNDHSCGFVRCDKVDPTVHETVFKLQLNFGIDFFSLEVPSSKKEQNKKICLKFENTGKSKAGQGKFDSNANQGKFIYPDRPPPDYYATGLTDREGNYLFLMDEFYPEDSYDPTKEYISLNYLYNTMRRKVESQLIRGDDHMSKLCSKLKSSHKADHVLAAEYALFILLTDKVKTAELAFNMTLEKLIKDPQEAFGNFHTALWASFESLNKSLHQELQAAFSAVADNIHDTVLRDLTKYHKDDDEFLKHILGCFLFAPNEESLEEAKQELKMLTENQNFNWRQLEMKNKMKHDILCIFETGRIVSDLCNLQGYSSETHAENSKIAGPMKVVRMTSKEGGDKMYATLCLARDVISNKDKETQDFLFELIRDYGTYKIGDISDDSTFQNAQSFRIKSILQRKTCASCKCRKLETAAEKSLLCCKCGHVHFKVVCYEDLNNLPCILILVDKGRMGDTFPSSFNTMDLRIQFTKKQNYFLSTVVQEIGRLCRYGVKGDTNFSLPYALLGDGLYSKLKQRVQDTTLGACYFSHFVDKKNIDKQVKIQNDGKARAGRKNYDHRVRKQQPNRFLLEAEPQVGKTGAYLCLINMIQNKIIPEKDSSGEESSEEESDTDEEGDLPLYNNDWQFPYWENMQKDTFPQKVNKSKYDRICGPYEFGKYPDIVAMAKKMGPLKREGRKKQLQPPDNLSNTTHVAAHNKTCSDCSCSYRSEIYPVSLGDLKFKVCIPHRQQMKPVMEQFQVKMPKNDLSSRSSINSQSSSKCEGNEEALLLHGLQTWIFTPSYMRSKIGRLNLFHSMVDGDKRPISYTHALVVRSEEFEEYKEDWSSSHIIFELPTKLPECESTVEAGGIGYTRQFIILLAKELGLKQIFMLDDNITHSYEIQIDDKQAICRSDGDLVYKAVPLGKMLLHLERQFTHCGEKLAPKDKFIPYPEEELGMLSSYTGPRRLYAAIGVLRMSKYTKKVRVPFKRTHITALVLINMERDGIFYPPFPVWEDLNFNSEAEKQNLWIVKYRRFMIRKENIHDWLPRMVEMQDDVKLDESLEDLQNQNTAIDVLSQWIKVSIGPYRLEVLPEFDELSSTPVKELYDKLHVRKVKGDHCLIVTHEPASTSSLDSKLREYFTKTRGIGGFKNHVIVLPVELCRKVGLTTRAIITEYLEKFFEDIGHMEVLSSHNLKHYNDPFLIVNIIDAGIRNACDQDAIGTFDVRIPGKKITRKPDSPSQRELQLDDMEVVDKMGVRKGLWRGMELDLWDCVILRGNKQCKELSDIQRQQMRKLLDDHGIQVPRRKTCSCCL